MLSITNTYSAASQVANPSASLSITVAPGEGLLVWVDSFEDFATANAVDSITFDGSSLALVATRTNPVAGSHRLELWAGKPNAGTANLVVTLKPTTSTETKVAILARTVSEMGEVTASAGADSNGDASVSCTVASASGELVVDGGLYRNLAQFVTADAAQSDVYKSEPGGSLAMFASSKPGGASSVTTTWNFESTPALYWSMLLSASVSGAGGGSESIILTPDPASTTVGGTREITITRSTPAPAGAGVTYNLTSDTPAVATVPATVNMAEGQTTATFDVTGVSLGSASITATNAADEAETDSVDMTVVAVRKLRMLVEAAAAGVTGVSGIVFQPPVGDAIAGAEIGEFDGAAFEGSLSGGKAEIKVPVSEFGGEALTTSDVPAVLLRTATHTTGITTLDVSIIEE